MAIRLPIAAPCMHGPGLLARHTHRAPEPPAAPPRRAVPPDEPRLAVRVMDNSVNTYQEVIEVCAAALAISDEEAFQIARTIDTAGSCVVCVAPEAEARRVAQAIGRIGIEVRLEPASGGAPLAN